MKEPKKPSAVERYKRDAHFEVVDGLAVVAVGKKRDGADRMGLAVVVYHFTNEADARSLARKHARKVFRVDQQRRTELTVRPAKAKEVGTREQWIMSKPLHEYTTSELQAELQKRAARAPRWGIFVPEQWVNGIEGSSQEVALFAATERVRGVTFVARVIEPITRPGQVTDEDG